MVLIPHFYKVKHRFFCQKCNFEPLRFVTRKFEIIIVFRQGRDSGMVETFNIYTPTGLVRA